VAEVIGFMAEHTEDLGVEPMCRVLQIAPSTWHRHAACRANPDLRSKRAKDDDRLGAEVLRIHAENFGVYGARKVWRQLLRDGFEIGRDRVSRLMGKLGLEGARRGRRVKTTVQDKKAICPLDRVNRQFKADRPNRLWVSDFTYVPCWTGMTYVAFVIDVFARRIVGWRVSQTASAQFVLDALEQAVHMRRPTEPGLIHHSDRGVQYVSMKYTERLVNAGIVPSVGSVGDSYDNAMAETVIGLFKTELIHRQGPWRSMAAIEVATMQWVDWYNTRRLLEPIGNIPPAEAEANYYAAHAALEAQPMAA
jgi:transposase InsO family protein